MAILKDLFEKNKKEQEAKKLVHFGTEQINLYTITGDPADLEQGMKKLEQAAKICREYGIKASRVFGE